MSASGSFDKEIIARLSEDASTVGMFGAVKLAAKYLSKDEIIEIIPRLPKKKRVGFIRVLSKIGRTNIVEAVYDIAENSERAGVLLHTSESFFEEHVTQEIVDSLSYSYWRLMAKRFPKKAMEKMDQLLAGTGALPWMMQAAVRSVIFCFINSNAELGIALLRRIAGRMYVGNLPN